MNEYYYSLKTGNNEKQYGTILRARGGELEELTGFLTLTRTGETSTGKHYEADLNVNGWGKLLYSKGGSHEPDIIGLTLYGSKVEIHKVPRRNAKIHEIPMTKAAKILEDVEYIRDAEMYIGVS